MTEPLNTSDEIEIQKIIKSGYDLEMKLEESMDGLREKLQVGSHASFFHHDFHPDLLLEMHQMHETLFKVHLAIRKKEYHHLAYLIEEANRHENELKKHLLELKMNDEVSLILQHIIKISEELIAYLELLYDNQEWFEMELVDREWDILYNENYESHYPRYTTKTQYHDYHDKLLKQSTPPTVRQSKPVQTYQKEELPRPELQYKRYYLYPHPE